MERQQRAGPPFLEGPLAGLRIVEFGHFVAGPYATLQAAYYGAEVIKVESVDRPDTWRLRGGNRDVNASVPFSDHGKNKLSITLDLKDEASRDVILRLVAESDAVLENYSLGVLERAGLGYESLVQVKSDLVMMSLQGYGRSGHMSGSATFGPSLMAHSGMTYLWTDGSEDQPIGSQSSYPDYVIALHAACVLLAALDHRDRTGVGQFIELAQADAAVGLIAEEVSAAILARDGDLGNVVRSRPVPSGVYGCAGHDRWCYIEVQSTQQWASLMKLVPGLRDLKMDGCGLLARERCRTDIDDLVSRWTATREAEDVMTGLQEAGVPAAVVADGRHLVRDPQLAYRGFGQVTGTPALGDSPLPGPSVRHKVGAPKILRHAPFLGQDTEEVLGRVLGLDVDEIGHLKF